MSAPNAQEEQKPKKLFSQRGTSFLSLGGSSSLGSSSSVGQTNHLNPPPSTETDTAQQMPESSFPHSPLPSEQMPGGPEPQASPHSHLHAQPDAPTDSGKPRTGVISSTIHYPPKPPAQPTSSLPSHPAQAQGASRTAPISAKAVAKKKSNPLTAEEREARIDNVAEKITAVLGRLIEVKNMFLSKHYTWREKLQLVSQKYPKFSARLGIVLAILAKPLQPLIKLLQRVNHKLVERNLIKARRPLPSAADAEGEPTDIPPPPIEKVSFLELAEKNIIFCDNRKRPLYSIEQLRGKHGYTASEEVIAPMIFSNVLSAFREVAPKAKAIPTPQTGLYAGIPMDQVMENIGDEEVMVFLNYVKKFPRGYVGKNFRITESFAGWVVSGTPED